MLLGMLQMVGTSRVAAANGALLEVALQDVTSAEGVLAQVTLVRALARVCVVLGVARLADGGVLTSQKMALQMLQVQVRLVAVRALVLAIGVLGRLGGCLSSGGRWSARVRR